MLFKYFTKGRSFLNTCTLTLRMKIAICGSMTFAQDMLDIKQQLESLGHQAIVPANTEQYAAGVRDAERKWENVEGDVIRAYYHQIREQDAVLILNKDKHQVKHYVGGNGLIEMAFAHVLGKKIFLLNPIPDLQYKDEIASMHPMVLHGNIGLVQ